MLHVRGTERTIQFEGFVNASAGVFCMRLSDKQDMKELYLFCTTDPLEKIIVITVLQNYLRKNPVDKDKENVLTMLNL